MESFGLMHCKSLLLLCVLTLSACSSLDAGWRAQRKGDYAEAQKQAILALSQEPRNPDVYRLIATTALGRGDYNAAIKASEFASALDGGMASSETLIRQSYAAAQDWKGLCESALRTCEKGGTFSKSDNENFIRAFQSLAPDSSAYGCVVALDSQQQSVVDGAVVKAAYAEKLTKQGRFSDALRIQETLDDPDVHLLSAANALYALQRIDEGRERLEAYVAQPGDNKEQRIESAAKISEAHGDYLMQAEFLAHSTRPANALLRGIALQKSFQTDEAKKTFQSYFQTERTPEQVLSDVETLLSANDKETATDAWRSCATCPSHAEIVFKAASLFHDAGMRTQTTEILSMLSDANTENIELQRRIFDWFQTNAYYPQALTQSDRLRALGVHDDDFIQARLADLVYTRNVQLFEREANAYIASAEQPAAKQRLAVAQLEVRQKNDSAAQRTLEPLAKTHQLDPSAANLYITVLSRLRQFEPLDRILTEYKPDLPALQRAAYFNDAQAETYFKSAIQPLLNGSPAEQLDAHMALSEFYETQLHNRNAVHAECKKALSDAADMATVYERIIGFFSSKSLYDDALSYTAEWQKNAPNDTAPYLKHADLSLKISDFQSVADDLNRYASLEKNQEKALQNVWNIYTKNRHADKGLQWFESRPEETRKTLAHQVAETDARRTVYAQIDSQNDEKSSMRLRLIDDYRALLAQTPEQSKKYAYRLLELRAYDDAIDAFRSAEKIGKHEWSFWRDYATTAIEAHLPDREIQRIVEHAETPAERFDMAQALIPYQALHHAESILKKTFDSAKSFDDKSTAFNNLIQIYRQRLDSKSAKKLSAAFEKSYPDNPDLHTKLANLSIRLHDWDSAVKHLSWLQASRPDARNVLQAQIDLARRAVAHAGAQALLASSLDAAEGSYHRLEWISQAFEQYGDYEKALLYAEKAWSASTTHPNDLRFKILSLSLQAGKFDASLESTLSHLHALRNANALNASKLTELSEIAHNAGYESLAQTWLLDAIALNPNQIQLKSKKLEFALENGQPGLISQSLSAAMTPPVADVMTPLKKAHAYQDALDAIDEFENLADFNAAAHALLSILPYYVQARGKTAALNALRRYSEQASDFQYEIALAQANLHLIGDDPCMAYPFVKTSQNPTQYLSLAARCLPYRSAIVSDLKSLRAAMTPTARSAFDLSLSNAFVQMISLPDDFLTPVGVQLSAKHQILRALSKGDLLHALSCTQQQSVQPHQHLEIITALAADGADKEALDYTNRVFDQMNDDDRANAAAIALIFGHQSENFTLALKKTFPSLLDQRQPQQPLDIALLEHYIANADINTLPNIIRISLNAAAATPSSHDRLVNLLIDKIQKQPNADVCFKLFASHASQLGLYQDALRALSPLLNATPDNADLYRAQSLALSGLHQLEDAWQSLLSGANTANHKIDYWQLAAQDHLSSDLSLQQRIVNELRKSLPHQYRFIVQAAHIALQRHDIETAQKLALNALELGGHAAAADIANTFEKNNAILHLPDAFTKNNTSTTYDIRAKQELAQKNDALAAADWISAAKSSPWQLSVYESAWNAFLKNQYNDAAESIIAYMIDTWPHAAASHAARAVYNLSIGKTQNAYLDYLNTRSRDITHLYTPLIAAHALRLNHSDFAQKLIRDEQSRASLDIVATIHAFSSLHADTQPEKNDFAKHAIRFLSENLPSALFYATLNKEARDDLLTLSIAANHLPWILQLSAINFK